jgi:hypothetical protein
LISKPAFKKKGRFMDMVHDKSDMLKPNKPKTDQPKVSQDNPDEPIQADEPDEAPAGEAIEVNKYEVEDLTPEEPLLEPGKEEDKLAPGKEEPLLREESEVEKPQESAGRSSDDDQDDASLTTPFLPDAKVEKRPLGDSAAGQPASANIYAHKFEPDEPSEPKKPQVSDLPATVIKPKKSSGWIWFVVILLLVAIGVVGGLVLYQVLFQQ